MPRLRLVLLWSAPLACALLAGIATRNRGLDLLDPSLPRWCFGDSASGGHSTAWTDSSSPWRFGLRLRAGFAYPYAAAGLHLATDTSSSLSYVPFEGGLAIGPEWSRHAIALRDLAVPLWWNQVNGTTPRSHPEALAHARKLFLENGMETPVGVDDTIEVRLMRLEGTRWAPLWGLVAAALLLSALLHLAMRTRTRAPGSASAPSTPVRDVALEPRRDEELRHLLEWIGSRYMDPAISVEAAGRGAGVHPRRIPSILRGAGRGSFPAFVNALRVEQSMRLLRETDRTVSEIAVAVGVPNVSHFHRLFKASTGRTPVEWRSVAARVSDGS